ncbi:MAG: hypothetical protein AAFZ06_06280, partial [Pseudomonadota bacterium]
GLAGVEPENPRGPPAHLDQNRRDLDDSIAIEVPASPRFFHATFAEQPPQLRHPVDVPPQFRVARHSPGKIGGISGPKPSQTRFSSDNESCPERRQPLSPPRWISLLIHSRCSGRYPSSLSPV